MALALSLREVASGKPRSQELAWRILGTRPASGRPRAVQLRQSRGLRPESVVYSVGGGQGGDLPDRMALALDAVFDRYELQARRFRRYAEALQLRRTVLVRGRPRDELLARRLHKPLERHQGRPRLRLSDPGQLSGTPDGR